MNNAFFQKLSPVILGLFLCGCQYLGLQPSSEERICTTMENWKKAMKAENVDELLSFYSDSYKTSEGQDKESMRALVKRSFDSGFMETVEIKMNKARVIIDGNIAKFGPVEFISDTGIWPMEITLQKENGKWLIIGSERIKQ
jgi:hypothetical protein